MRISSDFNSKYFVSADEDYEEVDGRIKREFPAPEYGAPDEFERLTRKKMEFNVVVYNKRLDEEVKVSIVPMYGRLSHGEVTEIKQLNRNRSFSPDIPPLVFEEDVGMGPVEENWMEKPSYVDYDDTNSRRVDRTGRLLFNDVNKVALNSENTLFPRLGKNFKNHVKDLYKKGLEKKENEKVEENDAWDYSEMPDLVCGDDEVEEDTKTQEISFEQRLAVIAKKDVKKVLKSLKIAFSMLEAKDPKKQTVPNDDKDSKKTEQSPSPLKQEVQEKEVKKADKKEDPKPSSLPSKVYDKKLDPTNSPPKEEKQNSAQVKKEEPTLPQKTQKKGAPQEKDKILPETKKDEPKSSSPPVKGDLKKSEPAKDKPLLPENEAKRGSTEVKKEEPPVQQKVQKKETTQQKDKPAPEVKKEDPPVQQKVQKKETAQKKDDPLPEKKVESPKITAPAQVKEKKKEGEKASVLPQVKKEANAQQPEVKKEPVKEVKFKPIATNREHMKRCGSHSCNQAWIDEEKEDRVVLTCTCECKIILHIKCSKVNDAMRIIEDPTFDEKTEVPCPTPSCVGKIARIDYFYVKQDKIETKTKVLIKPRPKKPPPPPKPKVKKTTPPSGASQGQKPSDKKLQPKKDGEKKKKDDTKVIEGKKEDAKVAEKKSEDAKANLEKKDEITKIAEKKSEEIKTAEKKIALPGKKEVDKKKEATKKQEPEPLAKQESTDKGKAENADPKKKKKGEEEPKKPLASSKKKAGSEASGETKEAEQSTRKSVRIIGIEEVSPSNEVIIPIQPKGSQPAGNASEVASGQQGSISKKSAKKERLTKKQKKLALGDQVQQASSSSELDSSSGKKEPQKQSQPRASPTNDWVNPEIVQKIKGVSPAPGSQISPGRKAQNLPVKSTAAKAKDEGTGNRLKIERNSGSQGALPRESKKNDKDNGSTNVKKKNYVLEMPFLPLARDRIDIVVGNMVLCSINLNDTPGRVDDDFIFVSQFESDSFV